MQEKVAKEIRKGVEVKAEGVGREEDGKKKLHSKSAQEVDEELNERYRERMK